MINLLTAIVLTPGGSSTVHFNTQTRHRTTQLTNWEECGPCTVFESYTLAFALQLRKKHGKTSFRVAEECQLAQWYSLDGKFDTIPFLRWSSEYSMSVISAFFEIGWMWVKGDKMFDWEGLFNNQSDALIIQIYSVIILYIFRASSLPNIRSFLPYFRHW
jgi:hypothetical protein